MFKGMLRGLFIVFSTGVLVSAGWIEVNQDNLIYVFALYAAIVGVVDGAITDLMG